MGREGICDLLARELTARRRGEWGRRPFLLVGRHDSGRTTLLTALTVLLARRNVVSVPVSFRHMELGSRFDLLAEARSRFLDIAADRWFLTESEGTAMWRSLRESDRLAVLADDLEEAFVGEVDVDGDRQYAIRQAVQTARRRGVPLVIASRPMDLLRALEGTVIELESLDNAAAFEYLIGRGSAEDDHRLAWLIEAAGLAGDLAYLRMAGDLHEIGALSARVFGTCGVDRAALRRTLADRWIEALIAGEVKMAARVPLNRTERQATVLQIAALAWCGLAFDTLEVDFGLFEKSDPFDGRPSAAFPWLWWSLAEKLEDLRKGAEGEAGVGGQQLGLLSVNVQLAASSGVRLGLVEDRKNGVRFPHSSIQAYLGSRFIGEALQDEGLLRRALAAPGHELLTALTIFSRMAEADDAHPSEQMSWRSRLSALLCEAADSASSDSKRLELLTTAVDIDSVDPTSDHRDAIGRLVRAWDTITSWDDAAREAKLIAVARVGAAARRLTDAEKEEDASAGPRKSHCPDEVSRDASSAAPAKAGSEVEAQLEDASTSSPSFGLYAQLYRICCKEDDYRIRLAGAHEIGAGGKVAFEEVKPAFCHHMPNTAHEPQQAIDDWVNSLRNREGRHRYSVQAWLLPMLVGSAAGDEASERLGEWVELVGEGMPLELEAALAQGFKYAANRTPRHPYEFAMARADLASRAAEMMTCARFWFARLTLVHALGLWAISGTPTESTRAARRHHRAIIDYWIRRDDAKAEHVFVREAAELVRKALDSGEPERFLWIDESATVNTVGSRSKRHSAAATRTLWIPPSAGWLSLDRRAQQLLADVVILRTLADRGDTEQRASRFGQINLPDLPLCLIDERCKHLRPTETAGVTQRVPGETCKQGCPVGLCPYPPKGQHSYSVELGEAFCRNQAAHFAYGVFRRAGAWQYAPPAELRRFWVEMEQRARL